MGRARSCLVSRWMTSAYQLLASISRRIRRPGCSSSSTSITAVPQRSQLGIVDLPSCGAWSHCLSLVAADVPPVVGCGQRAFEFGQMLRDSSRSQPGPFEGRGPSVLPWQQDGGNATVGLGDDVQPIGVVLLAIGGVDAGAALNRPVVGGPIVLVNVAPIAGGVPCEPMLDVDTLPCDGLGRSRGDRQPAQGKQRPRHRDDALIL